MKKIVFTGMLMFVMMSFSAFAQTSISGTVTDADDGTSLPGVSVVVKGTTSGTITNADGTYQIDAPGDATLVFSFVGYNTTEVPVDGRTTIDIALQSALVGLEEVIVIAYGTTTRESFTGVADVISNEKIERRPVSNISRALEGVAPGVQVSSSSGQPGEGDAIRLRGFGSVSSSNAPLYVLDGVPFDGTLNSINPSDIENVSILRDASASALYGARGANGVIIITTKKGDSGKPTMTFNSRVGFSDRAIPEYDRVNEQEYYEVMWEAYRNALVATDEYTQEEAGIVASGLSDDPSEVGIYENLGFYNPYNVEPDQLIDPVTGQLNPNAQLQYSEDWQDELARTGIRQDYQFNVSGGSDISDYFVSFGYLNEEGIINHSGFERINARINLNAQPTTWFETGLNLSGSTAEQDFFVTNSTATTNPFYFSRVMGPIYPVYLHDDEGNVVLDDNGDKVFDYGTPYITADGTDTINRVRPYAGLANLAGTLALDDRSHKHDAVGARTYAQFNILEGLNFRMNLSTDYYSRYQTTFQNPEFGDAANVSGRSTKTYFRNLTLTFNQLLNYSREFGDHNVDVLFGHESYSFRLNNLSATRVGFPLPGNTEIGVAATAEGSNSYEDNYRIEGYFSRLSYDYLNKYYISGSFRRDGSSRFYEDIRWGNFWSVGGSWRASQEDFLSDINWLDNLRVKASYGEQGNDALLTGGNANYYAWQGLYELGVDNYIYNGALLSSLENRSLQWEVNKNTNIGVDFRLFDRVEAEVDYFIRQSENLLFNVPLPTSTGITILSQNIGAMRNNGIEARLLVDIVKGSNFRWSTDLNVTHFTNEITKLPEGEGIVSGTKRLEEGRSLYDFWIREFAGVDPENGDALYYVDVLDDEGEPTGERETTNVVADADRYYVGTSIPDFYGGMTNNFVIGDFDLSVLTTFSYGGDMYDNAYLTLMHSGRYGSHWHSDILDRWQQPGDQTDVPRVENGNPNLNGFSTRHLFDMSYFTIKNVTVGYNVPRALTQQIGIADLRIFAQADNLAIFSTEPGMNPQASFAGAGDHSYFPVRTITFGANLQF